MSILFNVTKTFLMVLIVILVAVNYNKPVVNTVFNLDIQCKSNKLINE